MMRDSRFRLRFAMSRETCMGNGFISGRGPWKSVASLYAPVRMDRFASLLRHAYEDHYETEAEEYNKRKTNHHLRKHPAIARLDASEGYEPGIALDDSLGMYITAFCGRECVSHLRSAVASVIQQSTIRRTLWCFCKSSFTVLAFRMPFSFRNIIRILDLSSRQACHQQCRDGNRTSKW